MTMNINKALNKLASKWLGFLILFILFAFLNYNSGTLFFSASEDETPLITDQIVEREFRGMQSYESADGSDSYYDVYGEGGADLGSFLVSRDNRWHHSGYAGPVPLMVKLDFSGKITEIVLLENRETPRFLLKLYNRKFLKSWKGMTLDEAADATVDTISGVTLTSRTIIANLSEYLESSVGKSQMGRIDLRKVLIWLAESLLLLYALLSIKFPFKSKSRVVMQVLMIAVLGFLAGDFISMAMIGGFLTGSVPILSNPILWALFLLSILIPALTDKSFYCARVCPFGAAQDLVGKLNDSKFRQPKKLTELVKILRPALFGILALIVMFDYKADLSLFEPFAAFLYSVAAPVTIVLAGLSLAASLFFGRPWCRWICPTGQFLEYFRTK